MGGGKKMAHSPKRSEGKEKQLRMRDKNAPKIPMNAYQRFVTHRLKVSPSKKFGTSREAMANFAAEWAVMDSQAKQPYFDEYIAERNEYNKKMEDYKKTADFKAFQMEKSAKRRNLTKIDNRQGTSAAGRHRPLHLPPNVKQIFSREFLEYNKSQEKRMRDVRAQISEVEDQIDLLDQHIVSLNDQMRVVQCTTRAEEAETARVRDKMRRWRHIVQEALDMDSDASLEAVIARAEQLTDELSAGEMGTQRARAALQQALKRAAETNEVPPIGHQQ
uniref:HMG box domain-containing protein n=1 Tax=Globodera rostochiensis TaxID=31243 RepID=A0A914HGG5_GLORO